MSGSGRKAVIRSDAFRLKLLAGSGFVCRLCTEQGPQDLDLDDAVGIHVMGVLFKDSDIGELSWCQRPFDVFLEGRIGTMHGADSHRL